MVDKQRTRSAVALRCLLNQTLIDELEIVLVDFADAEPLPGSDHPSVRLFREVKQRSIGQLRADYIAHAKAPIVAFYEDHVTVDNRWTEAILTAHMNDVVGVGGEVHNGNADQGISDVCWLFSYGRWLPPVPHGAATLLPGNNASYKRDILLSYGELLPSLLEIDMLLQQQLSKDGYSLMLEPTIKFAHSNEITVSSLCKGYYWFNRCLGNARLYMGLWSPYKRLFYMLISPIVPFIRTLKTVRYFARHRPSYLVTVVRHVHWLLLANSCAVIGQIMGIMPGSKIGLASVRFLDYELNEPRGVSNATITP
jgi:hypothetical protein